MKKSGRLLAAAIVGTIGAVFFAAIPAAITAFSLLFSIGVQGALLSAFIDIIYYTYIIITVINTWKAYMANDTFLARRCRTMYTFVWVFTFIEAIMNWQDISGAGWITYIMVAGYIVKALFFIVAGALTFSEQDEDTKSLE